MRFSLDQTKSTWVYVWSAALRAARRPPRTGSAYSLVARFGDKTLANSFECIAIRPDFEKRIPRDSHVTVDPFPIVQLDDCLTGNKFTLWVDDLPFSGRRIYRRPQFVTLITRNGRCSDLPKSSN